MPSFPVVVEDTSPMLSFSPSAWRAGVSGDSQLDQYSDASYLLTQTDQATISFGFFGSAVQVYGSKRSYHGDYRVQVDQNSAVFNGESSAEFFQQLLFGANLTLGDHTLLFTNVNTNFTDLDYITFQTSVGKDDEPLIVNTFKDNHPHFTYSPSSSWGTPAMVSRFIGSTGHGTTAASASANFTFQAATHSFLIPRIVRRRSSTGDAVALYGPVGPNSCPSYTVKIDNGNASVFSAIRQFYRSQTLLFFAANLGAGKHTLQIQLPGSSNSGEFAIDFATVYTTPSLGGSNIVESNSTVFGLPPLSNPLPSRTTKLEKNLIVAVAVISSVAVLVIIGCLYFIRRQRRAIRAKEEVPPPRRSNISPFDTSAPTEVAPIPETRQPRAYPSTQSLGNRRGKLDQNAMPVAGSQAAYIVASSSGVQSGSELRVDVDRTSISPPHYTVSPDESLANSGSGGSTSSPIVFS